MTANAEPAPSSPYIDLLKRALRNYVYLGGDTTSEEFRCVTHYDLERAQWNVDRMALPATLLTAAQLDLVEQAVLAVERRGVPGDLLEAGVWRGGVIALMRALLDEHGIAARRVHAADSFAGIPKNTRATGDPVDDWPDRWIASLEEVQGIIRRFGLLDQRIVFSVGFFEETFPRLTDERFAVIRLDSDSYDSVETSLEYLYPRVSQGGIVIIDDWHLPGCRMAVEQYRGQLGIRDEIGVVEGNAWWIKSQPYGWPTPP
jgi:O-methyltransferase/8-demethyl-8-(2,3-dimethoxy-alpha-L-rhamnosyl)tetracenomycin-C 4'-O-methyltransferase